MGWRRGSTVEGGGALHWLPPGPGPSPIPNMGRDGLSVCTQKTSGGPRLSQCPAPARAVPGAPWEQLSTPESHCVSPGTPGGRGWGGVDIYFLEFALDL